MESTAQQIRAHEAQLEVTKRNLNLIVSSQIIDENHFQLPTILRCIETLLTVVTNVLDQPSIIKYRQIAVRKLAARPSLPGSEQFLVEAGFRTIVKDFERWWTFTGREDTHEWQVLQAAREVLADKQAMLIKKIERKAAEKQDDDEQHLAKLRAQMDADRKDRLDRFKYS